jgi:hypothetical protein
MNDETNGPSGTDPNVDGSPDHDPGTAEEPAGRSDAGSGSGTNGRHRGSSAPERIKWAGVAGAFVTVVILLAQMYGIVTGNEETTNKIIEKTERIPAVVDKAQELGDAFKDLQDQIQDMPTPVNTTIVQPGTPGAPGKPGQVVTSPPRTVVVTTAAPATPGPTVTVSPSPRPTCGTSLLGACIVP